jgi:hypothetical protein
MKKEKKELLSPKYVIENEEIAEWNDEPPWRSIHLDAVGNTLEELLDDAYVCYVDQDGGEIGAQERLQDSGYESEGLKEIEATIIRVAMEETLKIESEGTSVILRKDITELTGYIYKNREEIGMEHANYLINELIRMNTSELFKKKKKKKEEEEEEPCCEDPSCPCNNYKLSDRR